TGNVRVVVKSVASNCGAAIRQSEVSVAFACPRHQETNWSQPPAFVLFPENEWHGGGRLSDFDWMAVSQGNLAQPNAAVADDFRSDGQPIAAFCWWGTYLPGFEPQDGKAFEDGYVLSFFTSESVGGLQRPGRLLGSYLAGSAQVRRFATAYFDQDGRRVHQYEVALFDTALESGDAAVAKPSVFLAARNTVYWISIAAQVGEVNYLARRPDGLGLDWFHVPTGKRTTSHFWGWQGSPISRESSSMTGGVRMSANRLLFPA